MILKIYSVYDTKVRVFHAPFFTPSRTEAERFLCRAVKDLASDYKEFTSDYVLFELGEFDNESGDFVIHQAPQNFGPLTQFQEVKNAP